MSGADEHTPTTEDIRDAWATDEQGYRYDSEAARFDRWLAAHDAGVREAAAKEAEAHTFAGTKDIVALCSCGTAGLVNALDEAQGWHARHVASIVRVGVL